jgi:AmmeMemoRadiSam system protein A
MDLTKEEKRILLDAARKSIEAVFTKEEFSEPDFGLYPKLKSKAGAFVTLTIDSNLRGCIGYIIGFQPLFKTVCEAAVQAAFHDPRFNPINEEELDFITLEISVLSEPFAMNNYDEIELGKHGLILEEEGRRGLLLPQVPVEHNMDKDQYLTALCRKAVLPEGLWRERTLNISMFTANVFSEEDFEELNGNN